MVYSPIVWLFSYYNDRLAESETEHKLHKRSKRTKCYRNTESKLIWPTDKQLEFRMVCKDFSDTLIVLLS